MSLLPQMHADNKSLCFMRPFWSQQQVGRRPGARKRKTLATVPSPLHVAGMGISWPTHGQVGQREHHLPTGRGESCSQRIVVGLDQGQLSKGGKATHSPPAQGGRGAHTWHGRGDGSWNPIFPFSCLCLQGLCGDRFPREGTPGILGTGEDRNMQLPWEQLRVGTCSSFQAPQLEREALKGPSQH